MKKALILLLTIIIMTVHAQASGLFPSLDDVYGTPMPSLYDTLKRTPDTLIVLADGSTEETWSNIFDADYVAFGDLLSSSGCEMLNYTTDGSVLHAEVGKDGNSFRFSYDSMGHTATLTYPKGTLDGGLDKAERIYLKSIDLFEAGEYRLAQRGFMQIGWLYKDVSHYMRRFSGLIAAGDCAIAAVMADGTVMVAGGMWGVDEWEYSDWTDIVAVSIGDAHLVGLKSDGTVVATGWNHYHQCDVADWDDIVEIDAYGNETVGLKADGTVITTYPDHEDWIDDGFEHWRNVVTISRGRHSLMGLKSDGTVLMVGTGKYVSGQDIKDENENGKCNVGGWTDIVSVKDGFHHAAGLRSDGTVVINGKYFDRENDSSVWTDIIAIDADFYGVIGLKTDGTVVSTDPKLNVSKFQDIIAIALDDENAFGLRSDGTIIADINMNDKGQGNAKGWNIFKSNKEKDVSMKVPDSASATKEDSSNDSIYYPLLKKGSKGEDVRKLQQALIDQGYLSSKADGDFGRKTEEAIKQAQEDFGLEVTGVADEVFQKELYR